MITRRRFAVLTGGALTSVAAGPGCWASVEQGPGNDGRLAARPHPNARTSARDGGLGLDRDRDAILHLPANAGTDPLPLIILLHGAGQSAEWMLKRVGSIPDEIGIAVLAPYSRDASWDAIRSGFGPDVRFLDRALERVFETTAIDPARVAIGGFSDGATYALSLGLINGDLFPRIVAFSPGFVVEGPPHGRPRLFISHGRFDPILPIDQCSRQIVPALKKRGYDVTFREFDGGHEVLSDVAREALSWVSARK